MAVTSARRSIPGEQQGCRVQLLRHALDDRSRRGIGDDELAWRGGPQPVGVGVDEDPVAIAESGRHRMPGERYAGPPGGHEAGHPVHRLESPRDQAALVAGCPPFVSQKMRAISATAASRSLAAVASIDCLFFEASLSAFQTFSWRSG